MKRPELLSPAGTIRNMRYAFAYGADAVYAGMPRYSLRVRNNDFHKLDNLASGIAAVHAAGKHFYLASNALPHNAKIKTFIQDMEPIMELGPDALIMADPGLILMVREHWPDTAIHLSVQANTMNYASVRFWQRLGIRRIILSTTGRAATCIPTVPVAIDPVRSPRHPWISVSAPRRPISTPAMSRRPLAILASRVPRSSRQAIPVFRLPGCEMDREPP